MAHRDTRTDGSGIPFLDGIADRLGLVDRAQAAAVAREVLEPVLGSVDQVTAARLRSSLPEPLRRRLGLRRATSVRFVSPERFLIELAEVNGVDRVRARQWTRAVFTELAEAVTEDLLAAVAAEIPALVRTFAPARARLAPPPEPSVLGLPEPPPLTSAMVNPRPSYLAFTHGGPYTGSLAGTIASTGAGSRR